MKKILLLTSLILLNTLSPGQRKIPAGGTAGQILKIKPDGYNLAWYNLSTTTTWGSITGTLSSQSDLQNTLNAKLSFVDTTKYTSLHGNAWQNGMFLGSSNNRSLRFRTNGLQRMVLDSNGKVGIGTTSPVSKLHIGSAPTASANYGLVSLGDGAFDGSTSGFFTGSANGTGLAMNLASGSTSDLINLQVAGVPKLTVSNGTFAPGAVATAYSGLSLANTYGSTDAASGAFKPINLTYTINNTGTANTGTATGIFLNATETALNGMTHNLMDLQVGGSSKFKVTSFGLATVESLTSNSSARTALFFPNAGAGISWNNNATIKAPGAGVITISNEGETDFARLQFGGTTSSFPALKRNATGLQPQLADDSGSARWLQGQGADVASASTITLGNGNSFELTGTTAINLITSTGWTEGSIITLIANENVTITNGTATSGSAVTIKLAGATNFAMTADDTLTLIYSSTTAGGIAWREVSRSVN